MQTGWSKDGAGPGKDKGMEWRLEVSPGFQDGQRVRKPTERKEDVKTAQALKSLPVLGNGGF